MIIDITISVVLGVIITVMMFYLINIKNNVSYRGPDSKDVKFKIYKKNDKCYAFEPKIYLCK